MLTTHEEEENILSFYNSLLGESPDREITVNLEELNVPGFDLSELDMPFSEDEVWKTISSLPSNKPLAQMVSLENFTKCVGQ